MSVFWRNWFARSQSWGQYERFARNLQDIPWFSAVGRPGLAADQPCLSGWFEWLGPEDPAVEAMLADGQRQLSQLQAGHGACFDDWDGRALRIQVEHLARRAVPWDDDKDPWYPPMGAVLDASATAVLLAAYARARVPPPARLTTRWDWFSAGRWPAQLVDENALGERSCDYVVF